MMNCSKNMQDVSMIKQIEVHNLSRDCEKVSVIVRMIHVKKEEDVIICDIER